MNEITSAKNKKERMIRAVELMLNNPPRLKKKKATRVNKEWRRLAPREESWFFAGDFPRSICSIYQTSILRRDLEKLNLIEYHPRAGGDGKLVLKDEVKHRITKRYVFRLKRGENGFLKVFSFICSEPDLFKYFWKNGTSYGFENEATLQQLEGAYSMWLRSDLGLSLEEAYGRAARIVLNHSWIAPAEYMNLQDRDRGRSWWQKIYDAKEVEIQRKFIAQQKLKEVKSQRTAEKRRL